MTAHITSYTEYLPPVDNSLL